MRERMRNVMRFSSFRMMWFYPADAVKHLWRDRTFLIYKFDLAQISWLGSRCFIRITYTDDIA